MTARRTKQTRKRSVRNLAVKAVARRPAEAVRGGVDAASPKLYEAASTGKHFKKAVIDF